MAEFIFSVLLSLSFSGGLMVLLLFFLCALLRKRVSSKWQYYIWIVVIVRLLLPFAPERNLAGWLGERLNAFVHTQMASSGEMKIPDGSVGQAKQRLAKLVREGIRMTKLRLRRPIKWHWR